MPDRTESKRQEVAIDDVPVMYVRAENGLHGVQAAFAALEAKFSSLRGRRFYGTYAPRTDEYRACVALKSGDDPRQLGLETWTIPGGLYVGEKMRDWENRIADIGKTFIAMTEREGDRVDSSRPSIEFYRSESELVLLLPIVTEGKR